MKVADLMTPAPVFTTPDAELKAVEALMSARNIRHMPVCDGGRLVGLVTHRDLMRASVSILGAHDEAADALLKSLVHVKRIMREKVLTAKPDDSLTDAASVLYIEKHGCLPVVNDSGELIGILTESDFVRFAMLALPRLGPAREEILSALSQGA